MFGILGQTLLERPWPGPKAPVDPLSLTVLEQLIVWTVALFLLVLIVSFLSYHRGRHVQSNLDRRAEARRRRRFSMSKIVEFGKSERYLMRAYSQRDREMPVPQPATIAVTPPDVVTASIDGKWLTVMNNNPNDSDVNVVVAVSAGGLSASVSLACQPEMAVRLTLIPVDPTLLGETDTPA